MQYVFFEKSIRSVGLQWGPTRSWGIFENFCDKSNHTFNCKLQGKMEEQDVLIIIIIIIVVIIAES